MCSNNNKKTRPFQFRVKRKTQKWTKLMWMECRDWHHLTLTCRLRSNHRHLILVNCLISYCFSAKQRTKYTHFSINASIIIWRPSSTILIAHLIALISTGATLHIVVCARIVRAIRPFYCEQQSQPDFQQIFTFKRHCLHCDHDELKSNLSKLFSIACQVDWHKMTKQNLNRIADARECASGFIQSTCSNVRRPRGQEAEQCND